MTTSWPLIEEQIRDKVTAANHAVWFKSILPLREENGVLTLSVPDTFTKDWFTENYLRTVEEKYSVIKGVPSRIEVEINLAGLGGETRSTKDEGRGTRDEEKGSLSSFVHRPSSIVPLPSPQASHGLNQRYTFEKFVVGAGNQFATAAAKAVADLPGGHYNPLFIYGGVGLGKTHMITAIGIAILKRFPQLRVYYVTAERFVNEVIEGIRYDKMPALRAKYRSSCDVLLVDDIQFIAGKDRSQEEFFHTFNTLFDSNKQIVLTADRFPKEMHDVEDRLRTRFGWGLIADIQPPDLETRVAILKKKAESSQVDLPDDTALWLASRVKSNVRELEGSLIRLAAYSSVDKKPITVEYAEKILFNLTQEAPSRLTIETIQKRVAERFKIHVQDIRSARRIKTFAQPRQIAMYLARKHTTASFPEIGHKFGGKDHSTVIHACKKIEADIKNNPQTASDIVELEKDLST